MKQDNQQIIEDYLLGNLSEEDRVKFEQQLQNDSDLKQEFEVMESIFQSAELSAREKLKMDFENIHNKHFNPQEVPATKVFRINPFYKRAAIIAVVIGLSLTLWFQSNRNSIVPQDQLFAQYFETSELDLSYRGDDTSDILKKLEESFNSKNYTNYIDLINQNFSSDNLEPELVLAKGQAHLELDQFPLAEESFKALQTNPLFAEQAKWYLGLSSLKKEDFAEARNYFEAIDVNTSYGKKAKDLLANFSN